MILLRVLLLLLTALAARAQELPLPGELAVAPAFLAFSDRTRQGEVYLHNTGPKSATYRISFQHYRMDEDGRLREVENLEASAAALLRFSPRQVTLAPGERQVVRLQLRRPEQLPEGEYRVHLLFRAVPSAPSDSAPVPTKPQALRVSLTAIPGISVPIEVVHGDLEADFALEDVHLQETPTPRLEATLVQKGRVGLRGTLSLHAKLPRQRRFQEVAAVEVVHYGDLPRQRVRLELPVTPGPFRTLPEGPFAVVLRDRKDRVLTEVPVGAHDH
mgnify:CR=1 FL=1